MFPAGTSKGSSRGVQRRFGVVLSARSALWRAWKFDNFHARAGPGTGPVVGLMLGSQLNLKAPRFLRGLSRFLLGQLSQLNQLPDAWAVTADVSVGVHVDVSINNPQTSWR